MDMVNRNNLSPLQPRAPPTRLNTVHPVIVNNEMVRTPPTDPMMPSTATQGRGKAQARGRSISVSSLAVVWRSTPLSLNLIV